MVLSIKVASMSNEFTLYERQQLEYWLRSKQSLRNISKLIRRTHTILSREIRRNGTNRKRYRADSAQRLFEKRKHCRHRGKLDKFPELKAQVVEGLKNEWSPDVIAGKLKQDKEMKQTISHESIYYYIYNKAGRFEGWYKYLRRGKCKRQKRHERKERKLPITQRISIHQRPSIVGTRARYGDWESDSVIFSKQKTALSVQSERKSKLIRMHKVTNKSAEETKYALIKTIESLPMNMFKTITFDNGGEGAKHTEIKKEYGVETYFCDPFASWQKGGVENANKLIRHYLPRHTNLNELTDRDIYDIQEKLNNRPRKCLNYQTPNEVIKKVVL
jgi:IS30 family transposase